MKSLSPSKMLLSEVCAFVFDSGAVFGLILAAYGSTVWIVKPSCSLPDIIIKLASSIATLIGTVAVIVSIYFPPNPTPPKRMTRCLTAPLLLLWILAVVIIAVLRREYIPDTILLGFSIAAIFGALMRTFPRYHERYSHENY